MYFLIEAKTFQEYSECFYALITTMYFESLLIVVIWKTSKIFKLMMDFEAVIAHSMYFKHA